jgi:hypothetical protein
MKYFILAMLISFSLPAYAFGPHEVNAKSFHIAQTEAELTLGHILDSGTVSKVSSRLTDNLKEAIEKAMTAERRKMCKDPDRPQPEPCSLNNPLTCGRQDVTQPYFATLTQGNNGPVLIMVAYRGKIEQGGSISGPVYQMVQDSQGWKLDGIACKRYSLNLE